MTKQVKKPKRKVNRVMIDPNKDDFYAHSYTVIKTVSLTFFDPKVNSNKFYVAEIHQATDNYKGKPYRLYVHHGRVGANGQFKAEPFDTLDAVEKKYNTKVREKQRKGYVINDVAVQAVGSQQAQKKVNADSLKGVNITTVQSKAHGLHPKVVKLVEHLYAETNQALSLSLSGTVKTDVKTPIGALGVKGINEGRLILRNIASYLSSGTMVQSPVIENLSIQYFRVVPRKMPSDLRKDTSWILNTMKKIDKEFETLDLYEDALRMLPVMDSNDILARYLALNTDIRYIEEKRTLDYLNHKVMSTHAPNHNFKLRLVSAYEIRQKNTPPFNPNNLPNVVNLFHGTRSANLVGILSTHLKTPQNLSTNVIKTGAMFGSGIYFAHNSTKSWNYSKGLWAGRKNKYPTAFLFVAEVAMGNVYKLNYPQPSLTKPPAGYHSVMGCKGPYLKNHEFVVYDPSQVRLLYLLEVEEVV